MGTLVNGIKEIFATAKTTGSNVMLCGNDGTPDGHMTMANLASVMGVRKVFNANNGYDANTLKINASVLFYTSNISSAQNLPDNAVYGILECIMYSDGRGLQKYHGLDDFNYRKMRKTENSGNTWGDWSDE